MTERSRVVLVPIDEIVYLKAELKYITIRTAQREFLLEESLTKLEEEFGARFVRVHRNCLVARDAIRGFERCVGDEGDAHWEVRAERTSRRRSRSRAGSSTSSARSAAKTSSQRPARRRCRAGLHFARVVILPEFPAHLMDSPRTLICGSLAYDTIMVFPDRFARHILPEQVHVLSVSFQIGEMRREWGGCAGNIAYNLQGLGGAPVVMATLGDDGVALSRAADEARHRAGRRAHGRRHVHRAGVHHHRPRRQPDHRVPSRAR